MAALAHGATLKYDISFPDAAFNAVHGGEKLRAVKEYMVGSPQEHGIRTPYTGYVEKIPMCGYVISYSQGTDWFIPQYTWPS